MHVDGNATFRKRWHRDNQIFRFPVFLIHKSKLTSAVIVAFLISSGVVKTENIGCVLEWYFRFQILLAKCGRDISVIAKIFFIEDKISSAVENSLPLKDMK